MTTKEHPIGIDKGHTQPQRLNDAPWRGRSLFSIKRLFAVAMLTLRHGMRMKVWLLIPLALVLMVVADLTSARFDPVVERVPRTIEITLTGMITVAVLISIFLSTFTLPKEIEDRSIYTVLTKPVSRLELIAGKAVGLSLLLAVCLAAMTALAWGYIQLRANQVQGLAKAEYADRARAASFPADLGALQYIRDRGPLPVRHFINPIGQPEVLTLEPTPPWRWIFGRSGELLAWSFKTATTIESDAHIRIYLRLQGPPEAREEATRVRVIIRYPLEWLQKIPRDRLSLLHLSAEKVFKADGWVEIPLTTPAEGPRREGLDYLGATEFDIAVICDSPGVAVGGQHLDCEIMGPDGRRVAIPEQFIAQSQVVGGKAYISGRSHGPYQKALFTFKNIPEARLPKGPVPLEFTLDLQPTGEKSEARFSLFNPATGQSKEDIPFTPESRRSTLFNIPPEFWHGGDLQVRIYSVTDGDQIGLSIEETSSIRLWGAPKSFAWNLAASVLMIWAGATLVACIGTMASARASWFVGILLTGMLYIASSFKELMFATGLPHHHGSGVHEAPGLGERMSDFAAPLWKALGWVFRTVLPDFDSIWPGEFLQNNVAIPWRYFATGLGIAIGYSLAVIAIGWLLWKRREVN